jgi:hypothetical protein
VDANELQKQIDLYMFQFDKKEKEVTIRRKREGKAVRRFLKRLGKWNRDVRLWGWVKGKGG